jgi:N-acetylglucosamine-6-sulfatase
MGAVMVMFWFRTAMSAALLSLCVAATAGAEDPRRPNIIVVVTDDQRFDSLGIIRPELKTPNMDRLAREGVRFRNAFVTTALCSPSRASLLTGRAMRRHGVVDNNVPLPAGTELFPERLQRAGYETALIGKWHMGGDSAAPRAGFDRWVSFPGQGNYGPRDILGRPSLLNVDGTSVPQTGYITDELTDYALDWLANRRDANKPYFLYFAHKAAHAPFEAAPRHHRLYTDLPAPVVKAPADTALTPRWQRDQRNSWHGVEFPYHAAWDPARWQRDYMRTLTAVDESLGRLIAWVEGSGQARNTIILFTSDNGFMQGEHGLIDKRAAYEPSMRVPMLLWGPGLLRPREVSEMVLNIDIAPTLLSFAGVDAPGDIDGRSFRALTEGGTPDSPWRDQFTYEYYWEFNYPQTPTTFALRTSRYKYIQYHGVWDVEELFDLQSDPDGHRNLIADPRFEALKTDLRQRLHQSLMVDGAAPRIPFSARYNQGAVFRREGGGSAAAFPDVWLRGENAPDRLEHVIPDGPAKPRLLERLNEALPR